MLHSGTTNSSTEPIASVSRAPRGESERPVDLVHLARVTFGDRNLERELLEIFVRQASTIMQRIGDTETDDAGRAMLAHTLKGSALGIGAWSVARSADALCQNRSGDPDSGNNTLRNLSDAVAAADGYIRDLLGSS